MSNSANISGLISSSTLTLQGKNSAKADTVESKPSDTSTTIEKTSLSSGDSVSTSGSGGTATMLNNILNSISHSVQVLDTAKSAIEDIGGIAKELEELLMNAISQGDISAADAANFNAALDKIDNIVENAEKQGVNILKGDKLETVLSESARGNLETEGRNVTSTGLPISHVNNLEPEALVAQLNEVREAIQKINNFSQDLSADLNTIQTRQDFTKEAIGSLAAADNAAKSQINSDEAASLLALQIGQQLGETRDALASDSQKDLLRLF